MSIPVKLTAFTFDGQSISRDMELVSVPREGEEVMWDDAESRSDTVQSIAVGASKVYITIKGVLNADEALDYRSNGWS